MRCHFQKICWQRMKHMRGLMSLLVTVLGACAKCTDKKWWLGKPSWQKKNLPHFIKPFFLSKAEKAFVYCFCWQDPMNCASVGTKNLGNTGVWTRNTKNTIVVVELTTYAHFCCKNHKVCTHFCLKTHNMRVAKIITYAHFCRKNHNIRALLSLCDCWDCCSLLTEM